MMQSQQTGVTLMELLIVVVVIGILAAVAYPSYRQQVMRSHRTEAKVAIQQRAQALEKCYTRYMDYTNPACAGAAAAANTADGHYAIAVNVNPTTYTITATPLGGQTSDAQCLAFSQTETGQRGVTGSGAVETCW